MIVGLYGEIIFNFVRNHQTIFHSGCTILHSHQQCLRVPIVSHPYTFGGVSAPVFSPSDRSVMLVNHLFEGPESFMNISA